MLFSDLPFLFFFLPLFFLMTWFSRKNIPLQNVILFVFSIFFYAWGEPGYVFILMLSLAGNYLSGRFLGFAEKKTITRKLIFLVSMIFNLAMLGFFKYSAFVVETMNGIFRTAIPVPEIVLPIGISFYTFQIMSYVIDVYRCEVGVQKNIITLGAYLTAFPQLIAGPVVRYQTIADELKVRSVSEEDFAYGIRRFITGLGKKVIIANHSAVIADALFSGYYEMSSYGALGTWLAVIAYSVQIYYDFSGYSDMAIGMARMMGFHYDENFNHPYTAVSVSDFWRRWHISLSSFFRDYVYIPMGGNRVSSLRWIFNMSVVWILTGLWHGASWNFIVWGGYFGFLLVMEKLVFYKLKEVKIVNHIFLLLVVAIGWAIFRSKDLFQLKDTLFSMFGGAGLMDIEALYTAGAFKIHCIAAVLLGILGCIPWISKKIPEWLSTHQAINVVIDFGRVCILIICIALTARGAYNPFIYFRF